MIPEHIFDFFHSFVLKNNIKLKDKMSSNALSKYASHLPLAKREKTCNVQFLKRLNIRQVIKAELTLPLPWLPFRTLSYVFGIFSGTLGVEQPRGAHIFTTGFHTLYMVIQMRGSSNLESNTLKPLLRQITVMLYGVIHFM